MTTEVSIYRQISNPVDAVKTLGASIAKSQMFGCQTEAQGEILALECMAQHLPPLSLARRFDLMHGKISMKSQTMLADFRSAGGSHVVVSKTPDRAAIKLKDKDGNESDFELTWDEAKQEVFPYSGKESEIIAGLQSDPSKLALKPKYATPRSRANMLWNRLISDSIRTIAPEINCGQYTADEIEEFSDQPTVAAQSEVQSPAAEAQQATITEPDVVEAEFEVKPAAADNSGTSEPTDGPISEQLVQQIKSKISEVSQQDGLSDIAARIKAKLTESGLRKLSDLSRLEGEQLFAAIQKKSLESWFSKPKIEGHQGNVT